MTYFLCVCLAWVKMEKRVDELVKNLTDDKKLQVKIKRNLCNSKEYSKFVIKRIDTKQREWNYIEESKFYDFVKDYYKNSNPELIPRMPKEFQKVWKKLTGFLSSSHSIDADGVNEITDVEELRRLYWKMAGKCAELEKENAPLKIKADKLEANRLQNIENAKKPRQ